MKRRRETQGKEQVSSLLISLVEALFKDHTNCILDDQELKKTFLKLSSYDVSTFADLFNREKRRRFIKTHHTGLQLTKQILKTHGTSEECFLYASIVGDDYYFTFKEYDNLSDEQKQFVKDNIQCFFSSGMACKNRCYYSLYPDRFGDYEKIGERICECTTNQIKIINNL